MTDKTFDWHGPTQSYSFTFMDEKVKIQCDRNYSECHHSLYPENFQAFNEKIGQPPLAPLFESVPAAFKVEPLPPIHMAIHEFAKVDFVWTDYELDLEDD